MERTTPVHCLRDMLEIEGRYLNLDNIARVSLGVNCLTVYSEGCATLSIQKPDGGFTFYETLKKDLRFKFFKGVDGDEFIKKSEIIAIVPVLDKSRLNKDKQDKEYTNIQIEEDVVCVYGKCSDVKKWLEYYSSYC